MSRALEAAPGTMRRLWSWLWSWLRQVSGDAAYENYLRHASASRCLPLTRSQFYVDSARRQYSTPSRCC